MHPATPILIAHRGGALEAPENTMAAFRHAVNIGMRYVELDVQMTRDGVPVVLHEAPLGTYLGWNITASGFHAGKPCNYAGGFVPFATTREERLANGDTRLSLEERYGNHAGFVNAVRTAVYKVQSSGFLLPEDGEEIVRQAMESDILR